MNIAILADDDQIAELAADIVVKAIENKPRSVLGLATGSTPVPLYDELVSRYEAGTVSFAQAKGFLLDEYVGLPPEHPESYINFIYRTFASRVDFTKGAVEGPQGLADRPEQAAKEYEDAIMETGGIDLQILGIGRNGHIGFNEPSGSLYSKTHLQVLTKQTRQDNARFFGGDIEQVPRFAITQGLGTINRAKEVILLATGESKSEAMLHVIEGGVSAAWPGSALQFHDNITIIMDEAAASKLKHTEHYRDVWEALRMQD